MDVRACNFLRKLRTVTKDPVWHLVLRLPANTTKARAGAPAYDVLAPLLRPVHVSRYHYVKLKPVLAARSLAHLPTSPPISAYPPWLTAHLLASKVRSPAEAHSALDLAYDTLDTTHAAYHPSLLVLATHALAAHAILTPASRVVRTFVTTPVHAPALHYNALLHALAAFPSSAPAADLAIALLEAMHDQRLPLWRSTYSALLAERFVTLQLTKMLREKMRYEGVRPDARQLQQYLRIFARGGAIEKSGEYLTAIREYCLQNGLEPPLDATKKDGGLDGNDGTADVLGRVHPANTLYLRALRDDPASAMQYLHRLLHLHERTPPSAPAQDATDSPPIPAPTPSLPPAPRSPKTSVDIHDYTAALLSLASDPKIPPSRVLTMFASLHTGAPGSGSGSRTRPTAVTYTALIRAFLHSKAAPSPVRGRTLSPLQIALLLWRELFGDPRLRLDRHAVAVGARVLVRSGRPEEAYWLLATFAKRGRAAKAKARARRWGMPRKDRAGARTPHAGTAEKTTTLSTIAVNEFMVSLLRRAPLPLTSSSSAASVSETHPDGPLVRPAQPLSADDAAHAALDLRVHPHEPRPALVFALFAHMHKVFGVHPDAVSLGVLLKAAVLAGKLERESVGLAVRRAVRSFFGLRGGGGADGAWVREREHGRGSGRGQRDGDGMARVRAGPEPLAVLTHSSGTPAVSGKPPTKWSGAPTDWAGSPAHEVARRVFRDVVLGNWPWLRSVQAGWLPDEPPPPSDAASPANTSPQTTMDDASHVQRGPWSVAIQPPKRTLAHPPYPTIHPTPACFAAYIQLLALSPGGGDGGTRVDEVPQVLAWMRALRMTPDRRILAIALVFLSERVYYPEHHPSSSSHGQSASRSASPSSSPAATTATTDFWSSPFASRGAHALGTSWMARWGMADALAGHGLRRRRDVFSQLVAWVDGWAGAPDEREMGEALRAVARMRDRSFGGPGDEGEGGGRWW